MAAANAADPWSMCAAAGSQAVKGWRRGVGVGGGVGEGGRRGAVWAGAAWMRAAGHALEPLKQCSNTVRDVEDWGGGRGVVWAGAGRGRGQLGMSFPTTWRIGVGEGCEGRGAVWAGAAGVGRCGRGRGQLGMHWSFSDMIWGAENTQRAG